MSDIDKLKFGILRKLIIESKPEDYFPLSEARRDLDELIYKIVKFIKENPLTLGLYATMLREIASALETLSTR